MITVKFRDTFRERFPEWVASICLVIWGLITLAQPDTLFQVEHLKGLLIYAPQQVWGHLVLWLGVLRVFALSVNGWWRPTAHIRAFGALSGMLVWTAIIISYAFTGAYLVPGLATMTGMFILDLSALWFAAGDAKVADVLAKQSAGSRPKV